MKNRLSFLEGKYFGKFWDQKRMKKLNLKLKQIKSYVGYMGKIILWVMKSSRIIWVRHVWRTEGMLGSIKNWRPDSKGSKGSPWPCWADRIKEDLRMIEEENVENLSMDREEYVHKHMLFNLDNIQLIL